MTNIRLLTVLSAFFAAGGCVEPAAPLEPILRSGKCGAWQCGANSPVVDNVLAFHDLHLQGLPNDAGLSLHRPAMVARGEEYDLAIENNQIVGRQLRHDELWGNELVGAEILLDTKDASPAYKIRIEKVRMLEFPFPEGVHEQQEVYVFSWSAAATPSGTTTDAGSSAPNPTFTNLCSNPPFEFFAKYGQNHNRVRSELFGMNPDEALVFSGDRIDANRKLMSETADPSWFNVGCAGHALAKLQLTRNTLASRPPLPFLASTHAMRQATLKLLTADYCGTGRAFTVAGQPLGWKGSDAESKGNFDPVPIEALNGIEAFWNENGAICLTTPRVEQSDLPIAKEKFPDVRQDIANECGPSLPLCSVSNSFSAQSLRTSYNTHWTDPSAKSAPAGIPVYKQPGFGNIFSVR